MGMTAKEKTYRVYATLDNYVYTDIEATSPNMARVYATTNKQTWWPSSQLDVPGERLDPMPHILGVEEVES